MCVQTHPHIKKDRNRETEARVHTRSYTQRDRDNEQCVCRVPATQEYTRRQKQRDRRMSAHTLSCLLRKGTCFFNMFTCHLSRHVCTHMHLLFFCERIQSFSKRTHSLAKQHTRLQKNTRFSAANRDGSPRSISDRALAEQWL